MKMKLLTGIFKPTRRNQSGLTLIETLIAVAIVGITAVIFINSMSTSSRIVVSVDENETAKNLAEYQMEYIKNQEYSSSYEPATIPDSYVGYAANITVGTVPSRDGNIQKITVTISHHDSNVTSLEGYKVN